MKTWLAIAIAVIGLVVFALTVNWWLQPLLGFLGANAEVIQTLADAIQIMLWLAAGLILILGWRRRPQSQSSSSSVTEIKAKAKDDGVIAQDQSVAARQLAVGKDFYGNVIFVADPDDLWQHVRRRLPDAQLKAATQAYLEHLVDKYQYLDFRGMGVIDRAPLRLSLTQMYVALKARIEMPEGETWARQLHLAGRKMTDEEAEAVGQRLSEPQPVLQLLQKHDDLIILGDPGAGKTTFIKYLTLMLATGETIGLDVRLPILVPLSAYANALSEKDIPLDQFICTYYNRRGVDLPLRAMLDEALNQGGALLLLDGLDEVRDQSQRHVVVERVTDFFSTQRRRGNKFIITSRIVGYREVRPNVEGLNECTLVDFEQDEIELFIDKWTTAIEQAARGTTPVAKEEAGREQEELLQAVALNPGVRQLAANPLLLTILALMKRQGVTLPERRVELYRQYIDTLLKNWNLARGLGRPPTRDLDLVETIRVLAPLALWMHETSPGVGLVKQGEMRRKLESIYHDRGLPEPEQAARQFLEDVRGHAGLLLERGPREYGFIHLTFQEYLAAVAIAQQGQRSIDAVAGILATHVGEETWHEVSLLTVAYLGIVQQRDEAAGAVVQTLVERSPGEPGEAVVLAGEAVADAWPGGVTYHCRDTIVKAVSHTMTDDRQIDARRRAAAGRVLAKLGDPRPEVLDPLQIEWIDIPEGAFIMGEGDDRHEVLLPEYQIGRFPITQAQYQVFVSDGGYKHKDFWREAKRAGIWGDGLVKGRFDGEPRAGPLVYGEPFLLDNHPVIGITWYEALAFCRWLSERTGTNINLPTEAQWEKAARGEDSRVYPWGEDIDENLCNYDKTGIGTTNAVGCFPGGASPWGVEGLGGNVWEWCLSKYADYPYKDDVRNKVDASDARRVLRGGSFGPTAQLVRCACRDADHPVGWHHDGGFRVVCAPSGL
ncbi:MAG: SUMF1/EgtB/PvdO family nonheme iron enzyme [Halieaceae bacterium]|nr:SUMF1/EgtB/PvdO family nonheme iron enzyme [Halieaceae bacterium]